MTKSFVLRKITYKAQNQNSPMLYLLHCFVLMRGMDPKRHHKTLSGVQDVVLPAHASHKLDAEDWHRNRSPACQHASKTHANLGHILRHDIYGLLQLIMMGKESGKMLTVLIHSVRHLLPAFRDIVLSGGNHLGSF